MVVYKHDSRVSGYCNAVTILDGSVHNVFAIDNKIPSAVKLVGHFLSRGIGNNERLATDMIIDSYSGSAFGKLNVAYSCVECSEDGVGLSHLDKLLVVEHHLILIRAGLENRPINVIDRIARLVAVLVATLSSEHFLACLEEYRSLGDHKDSCAETVHSKSFLYGIVTV